METVIIVRLLWSIILLTYNKRKGFNMYMCQPYTICLEKSI